MKALMFVYSEHFENFKTNSRKKLIKISLKVFLNFAFFLKKSDLSEIKNS